MKIQKAFMLFNKCVLCLLLTFVAVVFLSFHILEFSVSRPVFARRNVHVLSEYLAEIVAAGKTAF